MKKCLALCLLVAAAAAHAQELPKEISGRWTWAERNVSQTFSLEGIQARGDGSFAASLTWWTANPRCAIRAEPVTGKVTATGISFDAKTRCDVPFSVELNRASGGWQGKGQVQGPGDVVVDIKAE